MDPMKLIYRQPPEPEPEIDDYATGRNAANSRKKARIPQKTVAAEMGVTQSYLCDLEHGRKGWSKKLAEDFNAAMSVKGEKK